jgi:hypothetical protein
MHLVHSRETTPRSSSAPARCSSCRTGQQAAPQHHVQLWSAADLLAAGVHEGAPAAVPDGQRVTAREWTWTGSAVEEVITTEALSPEPTRQERFDQAASVGNPLTDALIAGLAEVKGVTVPEAKAWLRGLV